MRHCGSIQTHPRKINVEPIKGMFRRCLEYTLEDERLEHVIMEVGKIIFLVEMGDLNVHVNLPGCR